MRESISNVICFFKIVVSNSKKFMALLWLDIILTAMVPFPEIILSKKIFDLFANGGSGIEVVKTAVFLITISTILYYLSTLVDVKAEISGQKLMFSLNIKYNLKSTSISYELLSHPNTLEMREMAGKAVSGSNFIDMVRSVKEIISSIIVILGVIAIFMKMNPLILAVIILAIVVSTVANSISKKVEYKHSIEVVPYMRKIGYIQEISSELEYGKEIRINSFKPLLAEKVDYLTSICFGFIKKIANAQGRGMRIGHISNGIQNAIVYSWLGYSVVSGNIGIGDFSMFLSSAVQFKNSLIQIVTKLSDMKIQGLYMGHFLKYMELPDEVEIDNDVNSTALNFDTISFENVSFKYPGQEKYSLNNISFTIKRNEKLSIVGTNGSGKTTIVKLLLGLYKPTEGRILIDGNDISLLGIAGYRKLYSVVFQDFKMFAFSLRENLCNNLKLTDEEIDALLERVNLKERMQTLPKKYDTSYSRMFDEDGVEFSGGETQKLAIARALQKGSPIVILDEPTAALDPLAEYEIYRDFDKLTEGKTAIYISHRLSSCRFCNNILVIHKGHVSEYGTHDELMKLNGMYADMYNKQAQFYVDNTEVGA